MERSSKHMKTSTRILGGLVICAGLFVTHIARVTTEQAAPVNVPGIDKPVIVVTGEVVGTEDWTNTSLLRAARRGVRPRKRHAEHPGRHAWSLVNRAASARLIVERGGRLNALGTA